MANNYTEFQILRGDSASNAYFSGRPGMITADMETSAQVDVGTLRLHDGVTPGGFVFGYRAHSSSYALTSSYAVSSSYSLSSSYTVSSSYAVSSSYSLSSSYNLSSSYATTAVTSSYAIFAGNGGGSGFPFTGDAVITGSLLVSGSGITGSLSGTSSFAVTASYALNAGSGGGGSGVGFPFSGSAVITGSLLVSGSGLRVTGSTDILGNFTATTKSFKIQHQRKPGKHLVYGVLEGPEHSVFVRGKLENTNVIILPNEWEWLVDTNTITVHLTPISKHQNLYVKNIDGLYITVENGAWFTGDVHCYYTVYATRKDTVPLETVV